jgi:hypothetical protein
VTTAATDVFCMKNTGVRNSFTNIKYISNNTQAASLYRSFYIQFYKEDTEGEGASTADDSKSGSSGASSSVANSDKMDGLNTVRTIKLRVISSIGWGFTLGLTIVAAVFLVIAVLTIQEMAVVLKSMSFLDYNDHVISARNIIGMYEDELEVRCATKEQLVWLLASYDCRQHAIRTVNLPRCQPA